MNNFCILYRYELKKLIKNKIVLLTAAACLLIIAACGIFNVIAASPVSFSDEYDIECNTRYDFYRLRKNASLQTAGRCIDSALLDEMKNTDEGTQAYFPYYDIRQFLYSIIDSRSIVENKVTEQSVHDAFSSYMKIRFLKNGSFSAKEQAYWTQQADKILSSPIIYGGYHEGWRQILDMMKVLVYMSALFTAISLSPIFTVENIRKTDQLIFSTKNGKQRLYHAKICAGITVSLSFTIILSLFFVGVTALVFGLEGSDVILQFVLLRPYNLTVGKAAIILLSLLPAASVLTAIFTMTISQLTKNNIATICIVAALLMLSLFVSEIPDTIRWLYELWYLLPANLISLNGAFRYTVLFIGPLKLVPYRFAFPVYALVSAILVFAGSRIYGKYRINAR